MTLLLAMTTFALALSASPGPVNIIALASGVNNGFMRTLPFVSGAALGFTALLYMVGMVGESVVKDYPTVMSVMHVLGTGYILYLGWKLMTAKGEVSSEEKPKPKFFEGAILQWLNPKAWIACLIGVAAFVTGEGWGTILVFCLIYLVMCFLGVSFWAVMGAFTQNFLTSPERLRLLNIIMGGCLCAVAVYLFLI
ncbi:LysE family translocator [Terasakiella sp. A23]|uniref:LysE family translocator n=1 Tax=Terasakiella sp. FCG-A23 TaxID=3080561 RepID=UPI002954D108|nr:LysE family translocator [Terasakiella sp. A23]MDV7340125.1 LysE family translocator [Terasakiella sp. A23]